MPARLKRAYWLCYLIPRKTLIDHGTLTLLTEVEVVPDAQTVDEGKRYYQRAYGFDSNRLKRFFVVHH